MGLDVGGVEQQVVEVREHPVDVEAVDEALDYPAVLGPGVPQAEGHPLEHEQAEVADERRQALAVRVHGHVVVGLGGVQRREDSGPGQSLQDLCYPGGGEGIRDGV